MIYLLKPLKSNLNLYKDPHSKLQNVRCGCEGKSPLNERVRAYLHLKVRGATKKPVASQPLPICSVAIRFLTSK